MGRSGVFFVATPAEVDGLDLAASPLGQLPAARVVPIAAPGPTGALACLVQVLDPGGAGDHVPGGGATDPGRPAPAVTQVDDRAVAVVQGADGDPELEWDDVVAQWASRVGPRRGPAATVGAERVTELSEVADGLRRLCGELSTDPDRRLYCWTAP